MKQLAYVFSAGLFVSMIALACDSSSGGTGTGTFGGAAGNNAGGSGVAGTTTVEAGSGGSNNNTAGTSAAGTNSGGSDPFGGGGTGNVAGTSSQGGGGTDPQGGGGTDPGQDCQTCATTSCANEVGTCQNNQDCAAIFTCIGGCQDQACAQECVADYPNGTNDFNAVQGCLQQNCATACGGGGGGSGGDVKCTQIDLGDGAQGACTTCGHTNCCSELEGCFNDADCNALNTCLADNNCADQACFQQCANQHPSGAQLFQSVGQCIQTSCATECQ